MNTQKSLRSDGTDVITCVLGESEITNITWRGVELMRKQKRIGASGWLMDLSDQLKNMGYRFKHFWRCYLNNAADALFVMRHRQRHAEQGGYT